MVPLDEISQLAVPQNYRMLPRPPRSRLQRLVQGTNSKALNLLLIALVLCILAIPVVIGLHHLQVIQPTDITPNSPAPTAVPTPALAAGFAGFKNSLLSIAYPSGWTHSSQAATLSTGTPAHLDDFSGSGTAGSNEEVIVGTATAVPSDELTQLIDAAARTRLLSQEVLQPLAPNLHKTYDRQQWMENDYTYTHLQGNANVVIEVRALVVDVGATTYFIVAYAPQASFGSANATQLEPMLRSFRFQGG